MRGMFITVEGGSIADWGSSGAVGEGLGRGGAPEKFEFCRKNTPTI